MRNLRIKVGKSSNQIKAKPLNNKQLVKANAKQYKNQGLSLSELIEIGNRGLKKAEIKTQSLKSEERKLSQKIWFIRQEILNEIKKQKAANKS